MSSTNDIDQERKLRQQEALERRDKLQEVVGGVQEGKLPTTSDITQSIDNVKQSNTFQETASSMSPAGQKVMADTERILDTAKKVLEEKNSNDELQTAIYHSAKAAKGTTNTARRDASGRDIQGDLQAGGETAQQLVQEGSRRAWNVARVVVTSSEFRRLINDLQQVLQDAIEAGISGDEQRKANVGSNIGDDRESDPRDAVEAVGNTGRQHVSSAYKSATAGAEPIIESFSAGEVSAAEAGKELGRAAARGIRSTVEGIELSDEQRDVLVGRFKKILLEAHSSDEFQSALDDLLEIVHAIARRGEELGQKASATAHKAKEEHDENIAIAHNSAKQLVEKFASGKSLDPLMNAIAEMGRDMRNDPDLRNVMDEMNEFMRRSLRDTDYIERADWNQEASNLLKRGRSILQERYRGPTDAIFDEASAFINALQRDSVTNELASDLDQLTRDLFIDDEGNPSIKFELVKDFAKIVPIVASKLEYIALPKIEYSDDEYDYILDNVVLRCSNIIPRYMHIHTDTHINIQAPGSRDRVQEEVSVQDAGVQLRNRIQATMYVCSLLLMCHSSPTGFGPSVFIEPNTPP
ncbi:hypothetical protein BC937DRAFT_86862 [Endogone sp. FLAS-F59071]|nr:hypothetical protein BC937DRAFT_86862 [Endogone sp. FLAS-F59071]|eukprot:RUS19813.1 hypothetical protein BC937DRAFT_86862 [Endogone sp. FLAS-F59071]